MARRASEMEDSYSGEREWSNKRVIRMIEEYKNRPVLWDSSHDLYRVQSAKYEAWSDMARTLDCHVVSMRKKLNSIFASHRREKAKIRNGGHSTWNLYPYMSFLPTHVEDNYTINIMECSAGEKADTELAEDDEEEPTYITTDDIQADYEETDTEVQLIKAEPDVRLTPPRSKVRKFKHEPPKRRQRLKPAKHGTPALTQIDSKLLDTLKDIRKSDLTRKRDEFDSFGEYIAESLRKHDRKTQAMIKHAINNIIFEQEMKKINNSTQAGHYTVVINGVEENPLIIGDQEYQDEQIIQ